MDPHPPADPRRALYSAVAAQPRAEAEPDVEVIDPGEPLPLRQCAFCGTPALRRSPHTRCGRCDSPLATALPLAATAAASAGRRAAPRFVRDALMELHLPGQPAQAARLRDVSLSGLSLACAARLASGQVLRAVGPGFDAVARVVACRRSGAGWRVHARMLTLQPAPSARGVFVSAKV